MQNIILSSVGVIKAEHLSGERLVQKVVYNHIAFHLTCL